MSKLKQQLAQRASKGLQEATTVRSLLARDSIKKRFEELLGRKAPGFMSSVINIVNSNTQLQQCDPNQVIAAAAVAAAMDLPIDPNLGFAYIVPYKGKAQFQMGYKGFVQLAMRTGMYKTINATHVYEGEIESFNRITGEVKFSETGATSDKIVGYIAYFKLLNGFEKYEYWPIERVIEHAKRFSQSYGRNYSPWKTDFDAMAIKTVLKHLLSRYGVLSIEMQTAVKADQAVVHETDDGEQYEYVDNTVEAEYTVDDAALDREIAEMDAAAEMGGEPQEQDDGGDLPF